MACFGRSLAGAGYVVLNVIRVLNIIAILSVIAASSIMLVKTFIVSKFYFFDACGHVIAIVIACFLILTELPLFKRYVSRNWPLFSQQSGFVMLGISMCFLGINVLGNLNKKATSVQSLGLPFWRIVIASGIVVLVMGVINIFASYIFHDSKVGLTARQVRSHGAVASHKAVTASSPTSKRKSVMRAFHLTRHDSDALPSYCSRSDSNKSNVTSTPRSNRLNISSPINNDKDQFAKFNNSPDTSDIAIPNLAHHPAMYANRV